MLIDCLYISVPLHPLERQFNTKVVRSLSNAGRLRDKRRRAKASAFEVITLKHPSIHAESAKRALDRIHERPCDDLAGRPVRAAGLDIESHQCVYPQCES